GRFGDRIRGLVSVGADAALATAGDSLLRLDLRTPPGGVGVVLDGLASPYGLAVDSKLPNRLFLAERDAITDAGTGEVLALELNSLDRVPVIAREAPATVQLPRPESLALESSGARLLAVTLDDDAERRVRSVEVGVTRPTQGSIDVSDPLPGSEV